MLASTTAVSLALGVAVRESRERERVVKDLERLGIIVQYNQQPDPANWAVECGKLRIAPKIRTADQRLGPIGSRCASIFQQVKAVVLSNEKLLEDSGPVATNGSMRCRRSGSVTVSDARFVNAIQLFKQLPSLERIYLESLPRFSINESRVRVVTTEDIEMRIRDALPSCALIREPTGHVTLRQDSP